jgi:muconate cycloisomerase
VPITAGFRFASGSAGAAGERASIVLVRITDGEGRRGWGEGRPMPSWSYETQGTVTGTIRDHLAPALIGLDVTDLRGLHRRMQAVVGRGPSTGQPVAKAAIDMAAHDLLARSLDLPLRCLLGAGPERRSVALSYTVTEHRPGPAAEEAARATGLGYRHLNFKVGLGSGGDVELARALRRAGPGAFLWADANQGYGLAEALRGAPGLLDAGVDLLEQPFPADQPWLLERLRSVPTPPLAVDESSVSPSDFYRYAASGLVDLLVVKLTRSGGIGPTVAQLEVAAAAGLPFATSGLTDGLLTKMAACQVAAAFGSEGPAALNGTQFIDETALYPGKAAIEHDGSVHLDATPGIGVEPDLQGLRELSAEEDA